MTEQIADGVHVLRLGRGAAASNVHFVRSGGSWVLVDAGWPGQAERIDAAAQALFGPVVPLAILLTHLHPDHSGSARDLATRWSVACTCIPTSYCSRPATTYRSTQTRWTAESSRRS